jgi:hypothetical protein
MHQQLVPERNAKSGPNNLHMGTGFLQKTLITQVKELATTTTAGTQTTCQVEFGVTPPTLALDGSTARSLIEPKVTTEVLYQQLLAEKNVKSGQHNLHTGTVELHPITQIQDLATTTTAGTQTAWQVEFGVTPTNLALDGSSALSLIDSKVIIEVNFQQLFPEKNAKSGQNNLHINTTGLQKTLITQIQDLATTTTAGTQTANPVEFGVTPLNLALDGSTAIFKVCLQAILILMSLIEHNK